MKSSLKFYNFLFGLHLNALCTREEWFRHLVVPIARRLNRERTICGVFNEINANLGRLDRSQILMSSTRGRWTVVSIPHSANLPSLLHVLGQKTVGIEPNGSATIREWRNNGYKEKAFHNQSNWEFLSTHWLANGFVFTPCRTYVLWTVIILFDFGIDLVTRSHV